MSNYKGQQRTINSCRKSILWKKYNSSCLKKDTDVIRCFQVKYVYMVISQDHERSTILFHTNWLNWWWHLRMARRRGEGTTDPQISCYNILHAKQMIVSCHVLCNRCHRLSVPNIKQLDYQKGLSKELFLSVYLVFLTENWRIEMDRGSFVGITLIDFHIPFASAWHLMQWIIPSCS